MSEAPERIIARIDYDGDVDGQWLDASAPRPHSFGHYFTEYVRADLVSSAIDLDAIRREARNEALREVAACCDAEADRCDDAAKWGGSKRYVNDCKAAAFAMSDRAAAIRAMKGEAK